MRTIISALHPLQHLNKLPEFHEMIYKFDINNVHPKPCPLGRAIAQAVSRRFPTTAARVQTRVWSCGIL
jgi:hypothetical protein